jgi:hypothetical protein
MAGPANRQSPKIWPSIEEQGKEVGAVTKDRVVAEESAAT